MSRGPIFIGGLDRSGKTLLRLALSSHPNIVLTRRTHMWTDFYNRYGDLGNPENFERCLQAMLQRKAIAFLVPDVDRIRKEFAQADPSYGRLFELFHQHFAERHKRIRWGEQEALIERYAEPIFRAYANAKIIHLIRDPRTQYGETLENTDVKLRLGKVGSVCSGWRFSAELARQNRLSYPHRYKVLAFEYFMTQPEKALREVCEFLDEEYDPAMLRLEGTIRFSAGKDADPIASQGWAESHVRQVLSASGTLTPREARFIETYAHREMIENGYAGTQFSFSPFGLLLYYFELPFNLARFGSLAAPNNFNG